VSIAETLPTSDAWEAEVARLERATDDRTERRWLEMTPEAQVRWLALLLAWAKALELEGLQFGEPTSRVVAVFRGLYEFQRQNNPGFVHGFARAALPKSASWRGDALLILREIRPERATPIATPNIPVDDVVDEDIGVAETEALTSWPFADRVRGLRVVLFGGEVREERRVALERAFKFASLDWVPRDRPRLVASLAERSSRGTVDFVLVTKFVSHQETATIQRGNAPMLTMRHGYGVATVRQVFEEYFSRADERLRADRKGAA
jgi:hypothetical protein